MGQRIDQFCEDLRLRLSNSDSCYEGVNAKVRGQSQHAELAVRRHLVDVQTRLEHDLSWTPAIQAEVFDSKFGGVDTTSMFVECEIDAELGSLQKRANEAKRYAIAAIAVALTALHEAEEAALEVELAQRDATDTTKGLLRFDFEDAC